MRPALSPRFAEGLCRKASTAHSSSEEAHYSSSLSPLLRLSFPRTFHQSFFVAELFLRQKFDLDLTYTALLYVQHGKPDVFILNGVHIAVNRQKAQKTDYKSAESIVVSLGQLYAEFSSTSSISVIPSIVKVVSFILDISSSSLSYSS